MNNRVMLINQYLDLLNLLHNIDMKHNRKIQLDSQTTNFLQLKQQKMETGEKV